MMNQEISQIVKKSMKDNRSLLTALGNEKPVQPSHPPKDEALLSAILDLFPKSTEGKLVLAGLFALVAYDIIKNRDR
jgi:hypothetical protein